MSEYLEPGDLVIFYRTGYRHWTVYSYDDQVISFTDDGWIREVDFEVAQENSQVAWQSDPSPFSREEIIRRARSKLGYQNFGRFNTLLNNYEHFAKWCRYNEVQSSQAKTEWATFGSAILAALGVATAGAVAVGAVAATTIVAAASVANATLSSSTYKHRNTGEEKKIFKRSKDPRKRYIN
ncbi:phospholipase A and acyltransferase 3-like [Gigantopelta aegis]|uniref:phospholipase A and acyltransferase 3-like n=1 Tax=Gigantopelta aegis TaxID=1735272 RepID=UPI001B88DD4E|nr:phospholipase A and acyltransferase 3-like [Gigantopelta aegis]